MLAKAIQTRRTTQIPQERPRKKVRWGAQQNMMINKRAGAAKKVTGPKSKARRKESGKPEAVALESSDGDQEDST